jgi:hypothetical protein
MNNDLKAVLIVTVGLAFFVCSAMACGVYASYQRQQCVLAMASKPAAEIFTVCGKP